MIAYYTLLGYGVKATLPALFKVFDYVDGGLGSIPCLRIRTDKYYYFCLPKTCVLHLDFQCRVFNISAQYQALRLSFRLDKERWFDGLDLTHVRFEGEIFKRTTTERRVISSKYLTWNMVQQLFSTLCWV